MPIKMPPMPKRKKSESQSGEKQKSHSWEDRKSKIQSVALYRDLAGWIAIVAKVEGKSVADLIDPILRPIIWKKYQPIAKAQAEAKAADAEADEPPPPPNG